MATQSVEAPARNSSPRVTPGIPELERFHRDVAADTPHSGRPSTPSGGVNADVPTAKLKEVVLGSGLRDPERALPE
jgi:hypothetical protein